MLQGASKTNISLIVANCEAELALRSLHHEFFEPAPVVATAA